MGWLSRRVFVEMLELDVGVGIGFPAVSWQGVF